MQVSDPQALVITNVLFASQQFMRQQEVRNIWLGWGEMGWGWFRLEMSDPQTLVTTNVLFASQQFMRLQDVRNI